MDLALILSCWGSLLATILAVVKICEALAATRHALRVDTRIDDLDTLFIRVTNVARRPKTIVDVSVEYGPSPRSCDLLLTRKLEPEKKLQETDTHSLEVRRSELLEQASQKQSIQDYRCRLFVVVHTSTGLKFSATVHVPHKIITEAHQENARDWIATDLFLGFPQMESKPPGEANRSIHLARMR